MSTTACTAHTTFLKDTTNIFILVSVSCYGRQALRAWTVFSFGIRKRQIKQYIDILINWLTLESFKSICALIYFIMLKFQMATKTCDVKHCITEIKLKGNRSNSNQFYKERTCKKCISWWNYFKAFFFFPIRNKSEVHSSLKEFIP